MRAEFPNTATIGGYIDEARLLDSGGRSGERYEFVLRNPTEGKADDVRVKVLGFGKKGRKMADLGMGALVVVTGRLGRSSETNSTYVVIDQVFPMDEEES